MKRYLYKYNIYYDKFITNKCLKNNYKYIIFLFIFFFMVHYNKILRKNYIKLNKNLININKNANLTFLNKLANNINIGIYIYNLKNGGTQRMTALLINYLYNIRIFKLYLFIQKNKEENEYIIPKEIKRIKIQDCLMKILIKEIHKNRIDILIYQFPNYNGINLLNKLKKIKIIFYLHYCFFYWIYYDFLYFKSLYKSYQDSKYVISLVPLENNFLFKKWGINSILMNNFITYNYNYVIPSNLSTKVILMIGRGQDRLKRYELGIQSMEYIIEEVSKCEMKIISNITQNFYIKDLVNDYNLEKYINFIEYTSTPEEYFKKASLHIFPTISESFGLVLSEAKLYGIPNILLGLDYVSISNGGIINIYDDTPESISKVAIKILVENEYKIKLGIDSRKSMRKFNNEYLFKKWIKLLLSIYNGQEYYQIIMKENENLYRKNLSSIIEKQLVLLKKRKNLSFTINELENFTYISQSI